MEISGQCYMVFLGRFSSFLDEIVLILVLFERSFLPAQVSGQSCS